MTAMQLAPLSTTISRLDAALDCARRGWAVFPLHTPIDGGCSCRKVECSSVGKHPRTYNGFQDATTDEAQIRMWWEAWPQANIGLVTGAESGLVVIDIDPRHGGDDSFHVLERQLGEIPPSVQVQTGGGGSHIYLHHPGVSVPNSTGKLAEGIDIKADGGYVVAPGSLHQSRSTYDWEWSGHPDDADLAEIPEAWLRAMVARPAQHSVGRVPSEARDGQVAEVEKLIGEGGRHTALVSLAGTMRRRGMSPSAIEAALRVFNDERCAPPLPESEVVSIARDSGAWRPEADVARSITQINQSAPLTDAGNAERFVAMHGADIRYVALRKLWLVWDGIRWQTDDRQTIVERAKQTARTMLREAEAAPKEIRGPLISWSRASESEARLKAMVKLASSTPSVVVTPDELDCDRFLLNVKNGTIDLRKGELRPHRREDLLTKLAPVEYDPQARLPLWDDFLHDVTLGDAELSAYLQRAAGYTLTGSSDEEVLFMLIGPSRTGKTTLLETLKGVMGDYARTSNSDSFTTRTRGGTARPDLARLAGARLVTASEVEESDETLAVGRLKAMTGGDTVVSRHLYASDEEHQPQYKIWWAANSIPSVPEYEKAMWERIRIVPMEHVVPSVVRDPQVKRQLRDPAIGGPAVLAWAVRGALDWLRDGLGMCDAVEIATHDAAPKEDETRRSDPLLDAFLVDCARVHPDEQVTNAALKAAWDSWSSSLVRKWSISALYLHLPSIGCRKVKIWDPNAGSVRGWRGIGLKTNAVATDLGA